MIYLGIGLYLLLVSIFFDRMLFKFNLMLFFIFLACDYFNGYDWINYYHFYQSSTAEDLISLRSLVFDGSPGFNLILLASKILGGYQYVFIISSIVFTICVYRFSLIFRNKNLAVFLCFSFFGYYYFVERIKQGLAIAFILLGYAFLRSGSRAKFFVCLIAAMFFHASALMALPLAFMNFEGQTSRIRIGLRTIVLIAVFGIIIILVLNPSLVSYIPVASMYMDKYSDLVKANYNLQFFVSIGGLSFLISTIFLYVVAGGRVADKVSEHAFLAYFFTYITNVFYGMLRVMNYFFPLVIEAMISYSERRKRMSLMRLAVFFVGLIQLVRPLANKVYFDSIFDYQILGLSSRSVSQMEFQRCNLLLRDSIDKEWADETCS